MKKIAIINYKGGVGKTTLTANIGAELAYRGHKVLLIDLDPQASLTFSFITPESWKETFAAQHTIKRFFDAFDRGGGVGIQPLVQRPRRINSYLGEANRQGSVSIVYSHLGLIDIDLELASSLSANTPKQQSERFLRVHNYLKSALKSIESSFDFALFDCPPNFGIVTRNAIVASDGVIIPAKPDYLSTLGIDYLIGQANKLTFDYNHFGASEGSSIAVNLIGVVFTMVSEYGGQPYATLRRYMKELANLGSVSAFDAYMKENKTMFGSAPQEGLPVVLADRTNRTQDSVVSGLESIVDEFLTRV